MEINITGSDVDLKDPRARTRAIHLVVKAICEEAGEDPADGMMMLLTAAAAMGFEYASDRRDVPDIMADALCNAIVAANDWYTSALETK